MQVQYTLGYETDENASIAIPGIIAIVTNNKDANILVSNDAEIIFTTNNILFYMSKYIRVVSGYDLTSGYDVFDNNYFLEDGFGQQFHGFHANITTTNHLLPEEVDRAYLLHYSIKKPGISITGSDLEWSKSQNAKFIVDNDISIERGYNTWIANFRKANCLLLITPTNVIANIESGEQEELIVEFLNRIVSNQDLDSDSYEIITHELLDAQGNKNKET